MTQYTSRRTGYPHHGPLQVPTLPPTRQQQPQAAATNQALAATAQSPHEEAAYDGELVTAPWLGLHYAAEAP